VLVPTVASAAQFVKNENYDLGRGDRVSGDLYVAGEQITVSGTVDGDVLAAGGRILVDGTVQKTLQVVGGQITVAGTVRGTVRAAGGEINISGNIAVDLVVAGGKVNLLPGSVVSGDLAVVAGNLNNQGQVRGKTLAY